MIDRQTVNCYRAFAAVFQIGGLCISVYSGQWWFALGWAFLLGINVGFFGHSK